EWLNQRRSPWFLWVHCFDPHDPYEPPEPFKTKYSASLYDGEVAYVDFVMKRLFQHLEDKDLFERTVIVFTGDHGESLGEHGEMTHGYFAYNSTIWIPLFVFIPGMKPSTSQQNVSHIDIFPTVCDALEVEKPSFLQGISLIPLMKGKKPEKRTIYFESLLPYYDLGWAPLKGIIQDKHKFIDSPLPELYDLEKDFDETRNLAQKSNLNSYRKQLNQIIKIQEFSEKPKMKQEVDRETLAKLRSLGYIGDYRGEKRTFGIEDDVKVLLPYHNKSVEALQLWQEGKAAEGIRILKEVITEKKTISTAYSNLASIYRSQRKLNDAIQVLRMGLEFIPESYVIFSSYVDYLSEAGRWNEIISVFEGLTFKQIEFDPIIWNLVGLSYSKVGEFEKARLFCERAISIDNKFSISYSNLGSIHFKIFSLTTNPQELPKALLYFEKALELDPKNSMAHDGLGLIRMYEGNYDKAIHHLEIALQLEPGINHAVYNLGLAYLKKGDKAQALSCFNRFKSTPSYLKFSPTEKEKLEKYIEECKE
ncbi:MAG: sulfatase-like hydrolase/transferase, partial [Candidatus Aminicenantes bacterium]